MGRLPIRTPRLAGIPPTCAAPHCFGSLPPCRQPSPCQGCCFLLCSPSIPFFRPPALLHAFLPPCRAREELHAESSLAGSPKHGWVPPGWGTGRAALGDAKSVPIALCCWPSLPASGHLSVSFLFQSRHASAASSIPHQPCAFPIPSSNPAKDQQLLARRLVWPRNSGAELEMSPLPMPSLAARGWHGTRLFSK